MMRALLTTISLIVLLVSCNEIEKGTPDCIVEKIKEFDRDGGCDDRHADKYVFRGKDVYVMDPGTCGADMSSGVFDGECNLLGSLGGITGNTQIEGEEFSTAVFIQTIWRNEGK